MPTVSVVIPTYNRAHKIGRAIKSVLNQTFADFEIIIVDDGSADNTEEVVKGFADERISYIRHKQNSGTCAAPRNTGIGAAQGEYIAFLSDDDEWLPQMLEKQVNKFKSVSADVGVIYCGYAIVNDKTGETLSESIPNEGGDIFESMVKGDIALGDLTPLVRKECFQKAGTFDTEFFICDLWDLLIRISKYYKFDFVPQVLCKYYIHPEQVSTSLERTIEGHDRITRKYRNYLSKPLLSKRLQHIGTLYFYEGNFRQATKYFGEALKQNTGAIYAYMRFLLGQLAPRFYQARLKRLYAKSALKYGGVISR